MKPAPTKAERDFFARQRAALSPAELADLEAIEKELFTHAWTQWGQGRSILDPVGPRTRVTRKTRAHKGS